MSISQSSRETRLTIASPFHTENSIRNMVVVDGAILPKGIPRRGYDETKTLTWWAPISLVRLHCYKESGHKGISQNRLHGDSDWNHNLIQFGPVLELSISHYFFINDTR